MINSRLRNKIKKRLLELEAGLLESIENAKQSSKPVKLDQQSIGRVSRIDAIQQQQISLSALQRQERQLNQVKQALQKIDDKDFGYCRMCEELIKETRLLARPEHNICLACTKSGEVK